MPLDLFAKYKADRALSEAETLSKTLSVLTLNEQIIGFPSNSDASVAMSNFAARKEDHQQGVIKNTIATDQFRRSKKELKSAISSQLTTSSSRRRYASLYYLVYYNRIISQDIIDYASKTLQPDNLKVSQTRTTDRSMILPIFPISFRKKLSGEEGSTKLELEKLDKGQLNFSPELREICSDTCTLLNSITASNDNNSVVHNDALLIYDKLLKSFADILGGIITGMRYSADIVTHFPVINPELRQMLARLSELFAEGFESSTIRTKLAETIESMQELKLLTDEALEDVHDLPSFEAKDEELSKTYDLDKLIEDLHTIAKDRNLIFYNGPLRNQSVRGSGQFGGIVSFDLSENEKVAAKYFSPDGDVEQFRVYHRIKREAEIWSTLKHENIAPIIGFAHSESDFRGYPTIICEFFQEGDLQWYMRKHHGKIDLATKLSLLADVASALAYMHSKNVVHGDIKANNILIDIDRSKGGRPKAYICDFGISVSPTSTTSLVPQKNTVHFRAPEHIDHRSPTGHSDMWALGCLFIHLMTGQLPWQGEKPEKLEDKWREARTSNNNRDIYVPPQVKQINDDSHRAFALRCLSIKKEERPSAAAAEAELKYYHSRAEC